MNACRDAGLKAIVQDPRIHNYDWTKVDEKTVRTNVAAAIEASVVVGALHLALAAAMTFTLVRDLRCCRQHERDTS